MFLIVELGKNGSEGGRMNGGSLINKQEQMDDNLSSEKKSVHYKQLLWSR
jgi:hypothetical protein